jgi:outer membrane protein OmpA-like peptidoglycan-associated protein
VIKKFLVTVAAVAALPVVAHAQSQPLQYPGFYVGAVGGLNWVFSNSYNASVNTLGTVTTPAVNESYNTGWAVGGMIGYDFVGPRVEIEGMYRDSTGTGVLPSVPSTFAVDAYQVSVMTNVLYDFNAGGRIVPYVGAGAGIAFLTINGIDGPAESTQFAYQAIVGVGYNIDSTFRINLEGRYYGTTNPTYTNTGTINGVPYTATTSPRNNNVSLMASLQIRFGAPPVPQPTPTVLMEGATPFMVFFDWDRSTLSQQALNTIRQAADRFKTTGKARITATGHADRSGPDDYNMALSLRRANAVKDALVRDGVPATAISVIGKGETQPLVPTADGVREPQNRRVEIVLQ